MKKNGSLSHFERKSAFLNFSTQYTPTEEDAKVERVRKGRSQIIDEIERAWRKLDTDEQAR